MNTVEIKEAARKLVAFLNEQGETKDLSKLDAVNVAAIQEEVNRAWTFEVWDKKSPINGNDAAFVLRNKKDEIPNNGQIYLLKKDGRVVYFQHHHPFEQGFVALTKLNVETIGLQHLAQVVDDEVVERILSQL